MKLRTLSEDVTHFSRLSGPIKSKVEASFNELADNQRGLPEVLATGAKRPIVVLGTGLFQYMAEHIGDLTHRMSQRTATRFGDFGWAYVKEKVNRALRYMTNEYGFERELREQVEANLRSKSNETGITSPDEWWEAMKRAGAEYADAHSKLTVYNHAQKTARDAAVSYGRMDFPTTVKHLQKLDQYLNSPEKWARYAGMVTMDGGELVPV